MARCSFCGKAIHKGTGRLYVKKDGKIFNFCSNKCDKNLIKLKRKPRTIKWTVDYQKEKRASNK